MFPDSYQFLFLSRGDCFNSGQIIHIIPLDRYGPKYSITDRGLLKCGAKDCKLKGCTLYISRLMLTYHLIDYLYALFCENCFLTQHILL